MAKWKRESPTNHIERLILTGMIVSSHYLRAVSHIINFDYLTTPFVRTVASWCLSHLERYKKAPKENIKDIFEGRRRTGELDPEDAKLISKFLTSISEEYAEDSDFNVAYILDETEKYFKQRAIDICIEDAQEANKQGRILEAESIITGFNKVTKVAGAGIDPLTDEDSIIRAFDQEEDYLLKLEGDLGRMIGPLTRGQFLGIAAPMKRGKSFFMQEIAIQAIHQGKKVAFFTFEMTREKMIIRIHRQLSGRAKYDGKMLFPVWDCLRNQLDECDIRQRKCDKGIIPKRGGKRLSYEDARELGYRACHYCKDNSKKSRLYQPTAWVKQRKVKKLEWHHALKHGKIVTRNVRGRIRLEAWPPYQAGLSEVRNVLQIWKYGEGFIPDIIITDYADIMRPENTKEQIRHQLDRLWKEHKALANEMACLVVTATQTNKLTFKRTAQQGDLSEDIRKLAHVDAMAVINQTRDEKLARMLRVAMLALRDEDFDILTQCVVLSQLGIGRFHIDSCLL